MKTLPGKVCISRVTSNKEPDYVSLRIEDKSSGVPFLDVKMSITDFAKAVMGLSSQPCEFKLRWVENVGMVREFKTEGVPIPEGGAWDKRRAVAEKALVPFEVDGWKGSISDATNGNRSTDVACVVDGVKCRVYHVGFTRFVPPTPEGSGPTG